VNEDVLISGLPSTSDDACYRAMDWLLEIRDTLEKKVFDNLADLLNLKVDLLFFDTTSTYFVTGDADDPVPATPTASPSPATMPARQARRPGSGPGGNCAVCLTGASAAAFLLNLPGV
jgi:hypothetical protein